jgi:photosystem II stability/assembly factor-like uncharacterized protein
MSAIEPTNVLVGTRKGLFIASSDDRRRTWSLSEPHHLGHIVQHAVIDPRNGTRLLAASSTGHLGPTVFRSDDLGASWNEATRPPAFRTGERLQRSVDKVFWLTPGHADDPDVWYAGAVPQGLFRSDDGGDTWDPVDGWNDHPMWETWAEFPHQGTPDGAMLHSVIVDPRDPHHLYVGLSSGGVFETVDGGSDWHPLNRGVEAEFLPDPDAEYGHDPHCVRMHPAMPDRLYQQNHCGLYRMDRPGADLGAHRPQHAVRRRRHRIPRRAASTRSRHGVGVPDGRQRRLAADEPGWSTCGVRHSRRRTQLAPTGRRLARPGVAHGEATGDDDRWGRSGRGVLRYDVR